VVFIAVLSLREQVRTVIGVGECEEQLAHGDFKTVMPAVVWENAVSPIVESSTFWVSTAAVKPMPSAIRIGHKVARS
jgi:hypothetical protein